MIQAVFFDLDGTLLDTAADMAAVLNQLLREEGHAELPYEQIRCEVSQGAKALIRLAFNHDEDSDDFERLRLRFLDIYKDNLARHTALFPSMDEVLELLEAEGIHWGVVTNKPSWLTDPLLDALQMTSRASAVISGDTASAPKPDPAPLLLACERSGVKPEYCVYVGDDKRDVVASQAAGMPCIAAAWGYIRNGDHPGDWGAQWLLDTPADLLQWLNTRLEAA